MAKAELKAYLGINSRDFQRGLAKARAQANDFAKKGIMVAGAAVVTFGAALAAGTKKTFAQGAALDHVRQQTGLGIKANMILSRTFKDAGINASDLGRRVAEMQRNLVEAERGTGKAADGLDELGLTASHLLSMEPDEQMLKISEALAKIEDPARRSAIAIAIMGTRGAELVKSLSPEALEDARKSLGKMPEIMERFGAAFERADTLMGRLPDKANQFFTGFASEVVGSILDPLERANEMDFTPLGQRLGAEVAPWLEAIQGGEAWDLFVVNGMRAMGNVGGRMVDFVSTGLGKGVGALVGGLEWGAVSFGNLLIEGIAKAGDFINAMLEQFPDFMGIDGRVDTAGIRKDKIKIGTFGETVKKRMDEAPTGALKKWSDEFWKKASDQLMKEPRMRAETNRALAEARGKGTGKLGDGLLSGGKHDDLLDRKTAFDRMNLSSSPASGSAKTEPTDFWKVIRRGMGGEITNWGELSDKQQERFSGTFGAESLLPRNMVEAVDAQEHQAREERESETAAASPVVTLLEKLVADVGAMRQELLGASA